MDTASPSCGVGNTNQQGAQQQTWSYPGKTSAMCVPAASADVHTAMAADATAFLRSSHLKDSNLKDRSVATQDDDAPQPWASAACHSVQSAAPEQQHSVMVFCKNGVDGHSNLTPSTDKAAAVVRPDSQRAPVEDERANMDSASLLIMDQLRTAPAMGAGSRRLDPVRVCTYEQLRPFIQSKECIGEGSYGVIYKMMLHPGCPLLGTSEHHAECGRGGCHALARGTLVAVKEMQVDSGTDLSLPLPECKELAVMCAMQQVPGGLAVYGACVRHNTKQCDAAPASSGHEPHTTSSPAPPVLHTAGSHTIMLLMELARGDMAADFQLMRTAGPYFSHGLPTMAGIGMQPGSIALHQWVDQLEQVCSQMAAMHQMGLLHNDVKPDNIMWTSSSRLTLIDFGQVLVVPADRTSITTNVLLTTELYAAPEVKQMGMYSQASDVYSLARVFLERGLGHRSYAISEHGRMYLHVRTMLLWAPALAGLLLAPCLHRTPEHRCSAFQLHHATSLLAGQGCSDQAISSALTAVGYPQTMARRLACTLLDSSQCGSAASCGAQQASAEQEQPPPTQLTTTQSLLDSVTSLREDAVMCAHHPLHWLVADADGQTEEEVHMEQQSMQYLATVHERWSNQQHDTCDDPPPPYDQLDSRACPTPSSTDCLPPAYSSLWLQHDHESGSQSDEESEYGYESGSEATGNCNSRSQVLTSSLSHGATAAGQELAQLDTPFSRQVVHSPRRATRWLTSSSHTMLAETPSQASEHSCSVSSHCTDAYRGSYSSRSTLQGACPSPLNGSAGPSCSGSRAVPVGRRTYGRSQIAMGSHPSNPPLTPSHSDIICSPASTDYGSGTGANHLDQFRKMPSDASDVLSGMANLDLSG